MKRRNSERNKEAIGCKEKEESKNLSRTAALVEPPPFMEGKLEWNQSVTTTMSMSTTTSSLLIWLTSTATTNTSVDSADASDKSDVYNWSFICVMVFVVAGTVGNVLVCLAVWLERPLQNVTNWFLVSLAFADLIVSTIVMPFGATAGFLGNGPCFYS